LSVQLRFVFLDKAFKFPPTFGKLFPKIFVLLIVGVTQVFSNSRVFFNTLEKVSASVANIIRITRITFEFVDNALLIF